MKASELTVPASVDPQLSEPPKRRGPKPGFKKKYSREAIAKLEKLNFDPIKLLVENHKRVLAEIKRQEELQAKRDKILDEGGGRARYGYSAMAHAQFLAVEQKLLTDILPYRYAKIPSQVEVNSNKLPPLLISLTEEGDLFEIDPALNDINVIEGQLASNDLSDHEE